MHEIGSVGDPFDPSQDLTDRPGERSHEDDGHRHDDHALRDGKAEARRMEAAYDKSGPVARESPHDQDRRASEGEGHCQGRARAPRRGPRVNVAVAGRPHAQRIGAERLWPRRDRATSVLVVPLSSFAITRGTTRTFKFVAEWNLRQPPVDDSSSPGGAPWLSLILKTGDLHLGRGARARVGLARRARVPRDAL